MTTIHVRGLKIASLIPADALPAALQRVSQVSRSACLSQKAVGSAAASSYRSALALALAANSADGGKRRSS